MDNPTSDSPLDCAVSLAGWLIRTGKQPPGKAIYIAARHHHVDRHAVAERVGQRGGRRAAAVARRDERGLTPAPATTPAVPSTSVPPPVANTVTLVVASVEYMATEIRLSAYPTTGPLMWRSLTYTLPTGWLPPARSNDVLVCVGEYRPGIDGQPLLYLLQFVRVEPASQGAQAR